MAAEPLLRIPPRPEMVFGAGTVAALPDLVRGLGGAGAFVVTDRGLVDAGVADRVLGALRAAGMPVSCFDGVSPNPSPADVEAGARELRRAGAAVVVAVGGGSPLDAAKAIALRAANPGLPLFALAGPPALLRPAGPLVGVPTTAGTGSETNAFGVIDDPAARRKRYLGHPSTMPRFAVLDPELTVSAPPAVTAACGIDVLAHAVESIQARSGNAYSAALALEAVAIVAHHLPAVVADGTDLEGRAAMLLAAHLAALAFATTGLGTGHAIGHALSARYGTAHGVALAAVLPLVAAQNLAERARETERIAAAAGVAGGADAVPALIADLEDRAGLHPRLGELGVPREELALVAADALDDVVVRNAPRIPSPGELLDLLEAAY